MTFDVRTTGDAAADDTVFAVPLNLMIRDVPVGPSEIDLDETRATLEGWPDLQGHLSITALSQDCSHGAHYCLVAVDATLSASARRDGAVLSVTGVTLTARGTYLRSKEMCAVIGE
jgi:hypothetical protein